MEAKAEQNIRLVHDAAAEPEGFAADLPGGLPIYLNPTIEGVESTWADLDAKDDKLNLQRGACAHAISTTRIYGQGNLKSFAARNNAEYSTVLEWMATYRRLLRLSDQRRERVLSLDLRYSHYRALNAVKEDESYEALLIQAHKKRWSVGKLLYALYALKRHDTDTVIVHREGEPDVMFEMGVGHYPQAEEFAKETVEALASAELYAKEGTDVDVSAPIPPKVAPEELADVGSEYERDVIERFADWLQDDGISLVNGEGEIVPFGRIIENYARALL